MDYIVRSAELHRKLLIAYALPRGVYSLLLVQCAMLVVTVRCYCSRQHRSCMLPEYNVYVSLCTFKRKLEYRIPRLHYPVNSWRFPDIFEYFRKSKTSFAVASWKTVFSRLAAKRARGGLLGVLIQFNASNPDKRSLLSFLRNRKINVLRLLAVLLSIQRFCSRSGGAARCPHNSY